MVTWIHRFLKGVVVAVPLAAVLSLQGCNSPTAPKFPEPEEDADTVTNDQEGMTRWRAQQSRQLREALRALIAERCLDREACQ